MRAILPDQPYARRREPYRIDDVPEASFGMDVYDRPTKLTFIVWRNIIDFADLDDQDDPVGLFDSSWSQGVRLRGCKS